MSKSKSTISNTILSKCRQWNKTVKTYHSQVRYKLFAVLANFEKPRWQTVQSVLGLGKHKMCSWDDPFTVKYFYTGRIFFTESHSLDDLTQF